MKSHSKISALLSALFMGLGQIYNKQYIKGLIMMGVGLFILITFAVDFQHAMWGLTTLGETKQTIDGWDIVQGDHSINLLIYGLIFLIASILVLSAHVANVVDAYSVGKKREIGIVPNGIKETLKTMYEKGFPFAMLLPSVFATAFLIILPNLFGVLLAFTNYSSPNHLPPKNLVDWVGFDTFIDLFKMDMWSSTFYGVFGWTVLWAILSTFTCFFAGLFVAIIVNQKGIVFKRFWRSVFILPWAIPQFVSILVMQNLFNGEFGPINQLLLDLGILNERLYFLSDPTLAKITIVVVNIWFGFPYWMVLMSGVMTSIDKELYEAADVDGANNWQKFPKITMPVLMFSTAPLLIMSFAGNFNNFNMIYLMTQGGPVNTSYQGAGSTDILISWIYKMTLEQRQYNMASVVSILIFVIIASISIWNFRRTKAFKEEDMMS
ncbi:sugar ABC transporter permease [Peribacillus deserti]|uniref:Maltose/maltodextrin transport system permease protein n=1 Tax=Peribacillus deserti TaxID=673318 RepID=A0A2N5M549_9BACI|nr:sugar ABC transporter permease [Peribacillus deserti]PLT29465.1 sugar ABC transporter permease [Peribacillus deserti]